MVDFIKGSGDFLPRYNQNMEASQNRRFRDLRMQTEATEQDARERARQDAENVDAATRGAVSESMGQPRTASTAAPTIMPVAAPQTPRTPILTGRPSPASQPSDFQDQPIRVAPNAGAARPPYGAEYRTEDFAAGKTLPDGSVMPTGVPAGPAVPYNGPGAQYRPGDERILTGQPPVAAAQPAQQPAGGLRRNLATRLAGVRGGGAAASQMALADLDHQQQIMTKTFEIAVQNPDAAEAFAANNGMPLPPHLKGLVSNGQIAHAISNGFKNIDTQYAGGHNIERRWQAKQYFLQGLDEQLKQGGGLTAFQTAGVPANMDRMPAPVNAPISTTLVPVQRDGKTIYATRDQAVGQEVGVKPGVGPGGRMSVFEQKRQAWLEMNPGDGAGALGFASGRRNMNPQEIRIKADQMASNAARGSLPAKTPAQIQQHADQLYQRWMQIAATPAAPPSAAAAPNVGVPAAPAAPMMPGGAAFGPVTDEQDAQDALNEAQDALDAGADPNAVAERLRSMGLDPAMLGQ